MAKITGPLGGGELRGSIGGATFCRASSGPVLRSKSPGPARRSLQSQNQANRLGSASAAWRALTPTQREQWESAAVGRALSGFAKCETGYHLFVAVAVQSLDLALPVPTTPNLTPVPLFISPPVFTQQATNAIFSINYQRQAGASARVVVRATAPTPPQLSATRYPTRRFLQSFTASTGSTNFSGYAVAWFPVLAPFSGFAVDFYSQIILPGGGRSPIEHYRVILA